MTAPRRVEMKPFPESGNGTEDARPTVRCRHCSLNQWAQAVCRRCGKPTGWTELVAVVEVPPEPEASIYAAILAWPEKLPTWAEVEASLLQEAVRRCGGRLIPAAEMLGIGRTTIYRKFRVRA